MGLFHIVNFHSRKSTGVSTNINNGFALLWAHVQDVCQQTMTAWHTCAFPAVKSKSLPVSQHTCFCMHTVLSPQFWQFCYVMVKHDTHISQQWMESMPPSPVNKEPPRQPGAQIQVFLPCRTRLSRQPFKRDRGSRATRSSRCWLNSTCTSAPAKKARAVQWTKQTPKPFAFLRRIAITISVTSHWLTHLFFCRATDMENSLISVCERWRNVCWWWKRC